MTTVADILNCVQDLAPAYMKESWDKIGLNCGHLNQPVTHVLVALDPFQSALEEAKEMGAQVLVTHHPLLWENGFITDGTDQGARTLFLIENGIAHINAHTNLDMAPGGVNDVLAQKLGLQNIHIIDPVGTDVQGRPYGLLRQGEVPEQSLTDFLSLVKAELGCPVLRYSSCGKPVSRVAVGGGACGSELQAAAAAGCDTFVTSDIKYNQFWDAVSLGINLIDSGHFYTENPVCTVLARKIRTTFPELVVKISEKHRDCMKFF